MIIPSPQDQDSGLNHCYYIRQLANQIWLKENERPNGIKIKFDDCIRRALMLHRRKLINNQVDKITFVSDSPTSGRMDPNRQIVKLE